MTQRTLNELKLANACTPLECELTPDTLLLTPALPRAAHELPGLGIPKVLFQGRYLVVQRPLRLWPGLPTLKVQVFLLQRLMLHQPLLLHFHGLCQPVPVPVALRRLRREEKDQHLLLQIGYKI